MSYHVIIISEKYIRMYASLGADNYFRRSIYIRMEAWSLGTRLVMLFVFTQPHMMDKEALIGDSRSPKFLVCSLCNGRNHKAQQCPCK